MSLFSKMQKRIYGLSLSSKRPEPSVRPAFTASRDLLPCFRPGRAVFAAQLPRNAPEETGKSSQYEDLMPVAVFS